MSEQDQPPDRPPLSSLRAFAAAGRRQSFSAAAAELGVSPSAVSHQIRGLESWIGAPLFERGVRRVALTERGAALSAALNGAFEEIDQAVLRARPPLGPRTLRIAALPLFTEAWLTPRLHRFEARRPELSLSIDTGARVLDLHHGEADVAIRNVAAPGPGLAVRKLLDLRAVPLCAPEAAARLKTPADLAEATLIGLSVGRAGWPEWLAAAGWGHIAPRRMLRFDTLPTALAAAQEGRGVILGLSPIVWDAPAARGLVAPFGPPEQDGGAYFVVHRKEDAADPAVRAFAEWLLEEMRDDRRRLRRQERARCQPDRASAED